MVLVTIFSAPDDINPDDFVPHLCYSWGWLHRGFGRPPSGNHAIDGVDCVKVLVLLQAPSNKGPQRFVAHAEGVTFTTAVVRSQLKWLAFAKVVETKSGFLFFVSKSFTVSVTTAG